MNTIRTRFLLIILLGLAACKQDTKSTHPQVKDLTEAVYASGNIFPVNEYKVSANADGFLIKREVDPGDTVTEGQELFLIDDQLQLSRYNALENIYHTARENAGENSPALAEAQRAMQSAIDKMKVDSQDYLRYKELFANNSISRSQMDRVTLQLQLTVNEYKARKEALRRLKNQLFVELQQAESNFQSAGKELSNTSVRSNIRGLVYDVTKEQGEAVRRNEVLAIVGDANRLFLKLQVDELDIGRVHPGQKVLVKIDIDPKKIFEAQVTKVFPKLNREDQSFRVDAVFTGQTPQAYYGVNAEANIVISVRAKVLTLPKTALLAGDTVQVKRGSDWEKIKVRVGAEGSDEVEILEGLTQEDEVVIK